MTSKSKKPALHPCSDDYISCSSQDIKEIEELLDGKLPDDYKEFVQNYGWSFYVPSSMVTSIEEAPAGMKLPGEDFLVPISNFYGGEYKGISLLNRIGSHPFYDYFPKQMLAIADDLHSDQYLLNLSGDNQHKIYFWYRDGLIEPEFYEEDGLDVPADWQYKNMILVANSFSDLLNRIVPEPEF